MLSVRRLCTGFFFVLLCCWCSSTGRTQQTPGVEEPSDQFFSGTVTALSNDKITVGRTVLGKPPSDRTFVITPETRIEGKLRLKARVTVRFVTKDEGDHAVHIIVRSSQKK
jgi:hypothetical protein